MWGACVVCMCGVRVWCVYVECVCGVCMWSMCGMYVYVCMEHVRMVYIRDPQPSGHRLVPVGNQATQQEVSSG